LLLAICFALGGVALAQAQKRPNATPEEDPVFQEYRGVKIGWVADEVRKKLGNQRQRCNSVNNESEKAIE